MLIFPFYINFQIFQSLKLASSYIQSGRITFLNSFENVHISGFQPIHRYEQSSPQLTLELSPEETVYPLILTPKHLSFSQSLLLFSGQDMSDSSDCGL